MQTQEQIQQHLEGLNLQQRDAVLCNADIVYVNAGPGTGKTHMLTSKLIEYISSATTPQKIVALSYTNTAARHLGERFNRKLEESGLSGDFTVFSGTIHACCLKMLKAYNKEMSDYSILDEEELQELADDIKKQCPDSISKKMILSCLRSDRRDVPEKLFSEISRVKESYQVMSMQDILVYFAKAIDTDEGFREWLRGQVTVIAVDEAQDLTELYYAIIDRMIAVIPGLKVFLVGDPRQNIFEFNGGSYKNLESFLSKHDSHVTKNLTLTYRCPQVVADYVNSFRFSDCANNQLLSRRSDSGSLTIKQAVSEAHEVNYVVHSVLEKRNLISCAILCNNLAYVEPLILRLCEMRIPYKVLGGRRLLKRHVRFLNHILRIIYNDNAYSIRKVAEYAGIDIVVDGRRKRSKFFESDLGRLILEIREATKDSCFRDMMEQVIERIMRDPSDDEAVIRDYESLLALSVLYETAGDYLLAFATDKDRFSQFFKSDYHECPVEVTDEYLTISTIHSAKGLEWDNVYIVGLCEGVFPNDYFCRGLSKSAQEEYFNEEWKKMYVASTRARVSLTLTFPANISRKGYNFQKTPSRFILNYINNGYTTERIPANHRGLPDHAGTGRSVVR